MRSLLLVVIFFNETFFEHLKKIYYYISFDLATAMCHGGSGAEVARVVDDHAARPANRSAARPLRRSRGRAAAGSR